MIPVKINGVSYNIPATVAEITLGQFMALRTAKDIIDEVCALTGLTRTDAMNFATKDDLMRCYQMFNPIGQDLKKNGVDGRKMPKQIMLGNKIIEVPKKLNLQPVGAFINVYNLIAEEQNKATQANAEVNFTDIIPKVLAHYFYQPYFGDLYNDEDAESDRFMALINRIPFVQAVPIANFFFRRFPNL